MAHIEYFTLGAIFLLSLIGHNMTVAYATGIVFALKALGLTAALSALGTQGLHWGIVLLTAAILVPIAEGTITIHTIIDSFKTSTGIIAILVAVIAAMAGGSGVALLKDSPDVVPALLIGTMLGVFFFHGVAVGPLIAGGFTYFILQAMAHFK